MNKKILIFGLLITILLIGSFATATDWATGTSYVIGDIVTYNGQDYICIQDHTSEAGWTPSVVPALWNVYTAPVDDGSWQVGVAYNIGDKVTYNDQGYIVRQYHTSQSDWNPDITPALFQIDINPTYQNELAQELITKYGSTELNGWDIVDVHASIKIITYDITVQNQNNGTIKTFTWYDQGGLK